MDLGLKGRVAIVAAASTGLGRAVARELSKEGAKVAICARTAQALAKTAEEIKGETGGEILHQAVDVRNEAEVNHFVSAVESRFGKIDICVTNSGGPPSKLFAETRTEEWREPACLRFIICHPFFRATPARDKKKCCGKVIKASFGDVKQSGGGCFALISVPSVWAQAWW